MYLRRRVKARVLQLQTQIVLSSERHQLDFLLVVTIADVRRRLSQQFVVFLLVIAAPRWRVAPITTHSNMLVSLLRLTRQGAVEGVVLIM